MASLQDIKIQIGGIKKTAQITKAMNMVAAAKLRGAQQKMEDFRAYASKFNEAMGTLSSSMESQAFPLMEAREVYTVELVVVTSDRGLCGSFNANIIKMAEKMRKEHEAAGKKVSLVCVGKKGASYFKKICEVRQIYPDIMGTFQMFNARTVGRNIAANFLAGNSDEVQVIYGKFISVGVQKAASQLLLPIQPVAAEKDAEQVATTVSDYIYEPNTSDIMTVMQPLYLNVMLYHAMLEVSASEHAARMTAMDNATNACNDMTTSLTLIYNKARQAAITADLMDIVGGAEALK